MQFSSFVTLALAVAPTFALPIASSDTSSSEAPSSSSTIPTNSTATYETNLGSYTDVEFPISQNAIITAVKLTEDVAPVVLDDAVYFINTTNADQDMDSNLAKREAEADAWRYVPGRLSRMRPLF